MRTLADIAKDERPEDNLIIIELLAAQVIAVAAYNGHKFHSVDDIRTAIFEVAGYPMLNSISGGIARPQSNIGEEAAHRVAALLHIMTE